MNPLFMHKKVEIISGSRGKEVEMGYDSSGKGLERSYGITKFEFLQKHVTTQVSIKG